VKICVFLEPAGNTTYEDICVPGTGGSGTRYGCVSGSSSNGIRYCVPGTSGNGITVDMFVPGTRSNSWRYLCTWNPR